MGLFAYIGREGSIALQPGQHRQPGIQGEPLPVLRAAACRSTGLSHELADQGNGLAHHALR